MKIKNSKFYVHWINVESSLNNFSKWQYKNEKLGLLVSRPCEVLLVFFIS